MRFSGGLSDGVELLELVNGRLSISVLPTRGLGVWRAQYAELPIGWASPVRGPVHPAFVQLTSRNGLGWLDGFDELLCRCGLAFNGPPGDDAGAAGPVESAVTLHGRIANLPAHSVEVGVDEEGPGRLFVRGIVDESTLFGPNLRLQTTISTVAGSSEFSVHDEIENLGSAPTELELLYHVNLGRPFLEPGATIAVPAAAMAPRDARAAEAIDDWATCGPPTSGYAEQVYYFEPRGDAQGETQALLVSAGRERALSVGFNCRELPRFTLWKCTQAEADGYVVGLEPGTNSPNFKSYERAQRRVIRLAAGQKYAARVAIGVHDSHDRVALALASVQSLQGAQPMVLHPTPQPGWSSAGDA
jgi:hypothetical protein